MPSETEIAWLAGLLEGEGSFFLCAKPRGNKRAQIRVALNMTDKDIVERAHALVGGATKVRLKPRPRSPGTDYGPGRDVSRWSDTYCVDWNGQTAEDVARMIRPYMGSRRGDKIDELLSLDLSHHPKETV